MKEIQLTQGQIALVDDEDYEELKSMKWYAGYCKNVGGFYAIHSIYMGKEKGKKTVRMHRYVMKTKDPKIKVDHIDGNTLNNQKNNLRLCENYQNCTNRHTLRSGNTTGYRGVSEYFYGKTKKWTATLTVKGEHVRLGYFIIPEEAALAFDKAARGLYGEFCGKLNFEEKET